MPEPSTMMFIRPRNCHSCGHGYYGLLHAVEHAQQSGVWNIIDITEEEAVKDPIYTAINQYDPGSFYGFGHGNDCRYTGDDELDVFNCDECDKLSGRIIYLLSCLTANGLGPEIMNQGAVAYAGFDISWTWMSSSGTDGDPYEDLYAKGFWESANELWIAVCDGYDFIDAVQQSINKYNEWIDYWYYTNPGDPYSQEAIMWLVHDRDGLVALTYCDSINTQQECLSEGCHWYNNSCHSMPQKQSGGIPLVAIIPVIMLVGIAFIAVKK